MKRFSRNWEDMMSKACMHHCTFGLSQIVHFCTCNMNRHCFRQVIKCINLSVCLSCKETVKSKLLSKEINLRQLRFPQLTWIFPPSFWPPDVDVSWSTVDNPDQHRSCPRLLSVQQYWPALHWMLHEENQPVDHTSKDWTKQKCGHTWNLIIVQFCWVKHEPWFTVWLIGPHRRKLTNQRVSTVHW